MIAAERGAQRSASRTLSVRPVLGFVLAFSTCILTWKLPANSGLFDVVFVVVVIFLIGFGFTLQPRLRSFVRWSALGCWMIAVGGLIGLAGKSILVSRVASLFKYVLPPVVCVAVCALVGSSTKVMRSVQWGLVFGELVVAAGALASSAARPSSTLGNPNYVGHYSAVVFVVLVGIWVYERSNGPSADAAALPLWAILLTTGVCGVAIVRTGSFGAVSLVFASGAYFAFSLRSRIPVSYRAPLTFLLVCVVATIAVFTLPGFLKSFEVGDSSALTSARLEKSSATRYQLWSAGVESATEHPTGLGFGVLGEPDSTLRTSLRVGEFHNDVLDMLAGGGFIALAGAVIVSVAVWRVGIPAGPLRMLFIGVLVSSATRQVWNFRHVWLAFGLLIAVEGLDRRRTTAP